MLGLAPWMLAVAVVIVFIGSATQASIGVGLGLTAAPTLSLFDEAFIPGTIVVATVPLTVGIAVNELSHVDWSILRAVPARFVGTLVGAWIVAAAGQRGVAIVVACAVLLAVVASLTRLRISPTPRHQLLAGAAAGLSGTAAGIGGPPMAIAYQHSDPRVMRASLAVFNTVSLILLTIPVLVATGITGWHEVQIAGVLVPGVVAGLWVGRRSIGRIPPERVRIGVLAVCAASAVVLLVRQLA